MCCPDPGRVWAVVAAAGRGSRTGLAYNKVFHKMGERTVLETCLQAFSESGLVSGIVLVLAEGEMTGFSAPDLKVPLHLAAGGQTRQQSVMNGLLALPGQCEYVLIHDGARPYVSPQIIRDTLEAAARYGSGVAATHVTDTIKRVDEGGVAVETLSREQLRAVQTPQTFRVDLILDAHRRALSQGIQATDDAALVERMGMPVHLVVTSGGERNRKITTPADIGEVPRPAGLPRVGMGYDVHDLAEGRDLVLCGVAVPHTRGLMGHSDADVAAHALMDALLGAAALGDIGRHFPDTDEGYRGADSMALLGRVAEILGQRGYRVGNVDITILAQAPKLAPYIEAMRGRVAGVLGMDVDFVSIKATTTEGLGFVGRKEGMAAQAVCMLFA